MLWRKKRKENPAGPVKLDRAVHRIVGKNWELLPPSDHWVRYMVVMRRHRDSPDLFDVRIYDEWCTDQKGVKVIH